jgi:hypothetical protein
MLIFFKNDLAQHYLRVSMVFCQKFIFGKNHEQILQQASSLELASGEPKIF